MARTERVSGHFRALGTGKKVKVGGYTRPAKPKRHTGEHKSFSRNFTVDYWQDDQGRLVSKRVYRKIKPVS